MTDWIEHNCGPQPVASNIWVECIVALPELHGLTTYQAREASFLDWPNVSAYRILNQHLIDAARLEGIRLGLEAAAKAADDGAHWASEDLREAHDNYLRSEGRSDGLAEATDLIRALNPDTIAREAQDMGSEKETT